MGGALSPSCLSASVYHVICPGFHFWIDVIPDYTIFLRKQDIVRRSLDLAI